jgi:CP family cyanate transporter-like MFS transporter
MNQHIALEPRTKDIVSEQLINAEADSVPQPRAPVFATVPHKSSPV